MLKFVRFAAMFAVLLFAACSSSPNSQALVVADASLNIDSGTVAGVDINSADAGSKYDTVSVDIAPDVVQEDIGSDTAKLPECVTDTDCGVEIEQFCGADGNVVKQTPTCYQGACFPNVDISLCKFGCDVVISQCKQCVTVADCDDGNWCTDDACEVGVCKHINFDDNVAVRSCEADGNPCTVDYCQAGGVCISMQVADVKGCMTCNNEMDCGNTTIQYCSKDGKFSAFSTPIKCSADYLCLYNPIEVTACQFGCDGSTGKCKVTDVGSCSTGADCDDGNACTEDGCYKGTCSYLPQAKVWFALAPLTDQEVPYSVDVIVMKFVTTIPLGSDIKFEALNFELKGLAKVGSLMMVKLYQGEILVGTATVTPTTKNYQVEMLGGQMLPGGTTQQWTLKAEFSPDISGSPVVIDLIGVAAMDANTACNVGAPNGLPLNGSVVLIK